MLNSAPHHGAVRAGNWKLVLNGQNTAVGGEQTGKANGRSEQVELFDLASDVGEAHNLAQDKPEMVSKFARHLRQADRGRSAAVEQAQGG